MLVSEPPAKSCAEAKNGVRGFGQEQPRSRPFESHVTEQLCIISTRKPNRTLALQESYQAVESQYSVIPTNTPEVATVH